MNYRHAYHAGNFADVLKHVVLALVIRHLKLKSSAFRVIDTHAGVGCYDLGGEAALKTGEWRAGIARLMNADFSPEVVELLSDYLGVVREMNPAGELEHYPGSPLLARRLMRPGDCLIANELHPEDFGHLDQLFGEDRQVKVMALDGWVTLKALLPPKERRGVILIDPPFEQPGEFQRLVDGLVAGRRRFATGTFILWYPIKDPAAVGAFKQALKDLRIEKLMCVELILRAVRDLSVLNGCGLVILNPPYELDRKLELLMPELGRVLGEEAEACGDVSWLSGDHG